MSAPAVIRGPRIRELNARQIEFVLRRNHVGRVAFMSDARVELQPIHYVFDDGSIYGRTSFGTKYLNFLRRPEVVLEVDEASGLFDWRSVIVRGVLTVLRSRGPRAEPFAYWNGVAAVRTLSPEAFTERDPMPYRSLLFRIRPTSITGREAVPR
jgi:uncharacterized protein